MSAASDIMKPIVGLATNQFIPLPDFPYPVLWGLLILQILTLLFWVVLFIGMIKDRYYEDPNNLILMSFALSDTLLSGVSFHAVFSLVANHGFSQGYIGCIWEALFLMVGFCVSGMSVVIIALDRYLLICHGYFASWSKTCGLLLTAWLISLVFPALIIFLTLPNGILLANEFLCQPNLTSSDPFIKGLISVGVTLLFIGTSTVIVSYILVFITYNTILKRKEGGQEMNQQENMAMSPKSRKLLKKLVVITTSCILTFLPLEVTFAAKLANSAEIPLSADLCAIVLFELGLFLNPILLYLLDAKMKRSVNEMLGVKTQAPHHHKKASSRNDNPLLRRLPLKKDLQLKSSAEEKQTIIMARSR